VSDRPHPKSRALVDRPITFVAADKPLPEGLSLNKATGTITSALVGGQGTYSPLIVVTDSARATASVQINMPINRGNAFLAEIFPASSIFHHRVEVGG
jgi:hypothetical protein